MTVTSDDRPLTLDALPMAHDRDAAFRVLREHGPVVTIDGAAYAVTDAAVDAVLHDPATFSSRLAFESLGSPVPLLPLAFDPPEHLRYRRLLAPFFSPGVISRMQDDLRRQLSDLLDPIASRTECEVVSEVCVPFPSQVFLTMLGLPLADTDRLVRWKDAVIGATTPGRAVSPEDATAAMELFGYLTEKIDERRGSTGDDLLTTVVNDPSEDALTRDELLGMAFLLVLAGLDTVTGTLSLAFHQLAADDTLRRRLAGDPEQIPAYVEDLVRRNPVATFTPRVTTQDTVLEGTPLPAGTTVVMVFGAANQEVEDRHWGFGGGVHRCLGSHLARAELRLVLEEWLARIPEFGHSGGAVPDMPWPQSLLGYPRLPLVLGTT
jgi:cytochrome P450